MNIKKSLVLAAAVAAAVAAPGAFATNGYMPHGIGTDAKAMGGVGIALPQGGMAAASNPAAQMFVGNRLTFGMDWFRPFRAATRLVNNSDNAYRDSGSNDYFMPEFGYTTPIGTSSSLGVVVHGAGLGVDYGTPWQNVGSTNTYMLLKYMYVAPTWAMKVGNHSFGASLNIVKGNVDVRGLQNFDSSSFTRSRGNTTDKGEDGASGLGIKLGWIGELTPNLSMGATYQPKTNMTKFGMYKQMLADGGDMDIPQQYGLGLAFKATPVTVVGFDVVKIQWSGVKSIANNFSAMPSSGAGGYLGDSNGPGFGWVDQTVYKLGVSHQIGKWTLRAGYNYAKMPIQATETFFNTLAPAVTEEHYTLGASWAVSNTTDVSLAYMYSPTSEIKGSGSNPAGYVNPDLKMNQNSFGVAFNVKM